MSTNASSTAPSPLRVGMVGGGTVGGGVYELCARRADVEITRLCVRDAGKARDFDVDSSKTAVTTNVRELLDDDDVDVVVEVAGGTGVARDVVTEALRRGKHVVTANKALVAEHMEEIETLANESQGTLGFEAAVCGGVPIIAALRSAYAGDRVASVAGICNGTTNYMLTKMEKGAAYDEVLKEAQDLGYAEADPTADVEGHDVRAKLAILVRLAFGARLSVETIPCRGITKITPKDFEIAATRLDATIKLLGTAFTSPEDDVLTAYVAPTVVPRSHPLASADGSGNLVAVGSDNLGTTTYSGPGAGRFPTANSVVADLARVATGTAPTDSFGPDNASRRVETDYASAFYVRVPGASSATRAAVEAACATRGVPVHDVVVEDDECLCLTTKAGCKTSSVAALCDALEKTDVVDGTPLCMPILSSE